MTRVFIKIVYDAGGGPAEAVLGTGCSTDVQDLADYLDDIDAFREIGLGESTVMPFDPRDLTRTVCQSDPARFVRGEVAEALRALAARLSGAGSAASAELVG